MAEYREAKGREFTPMMQMGVVVLLITVIFLFMGLSGQSVMTHNIYYLLMFYGSLLACYFLYKDEIGEKLHFTTKNFPFQNVIIYGVLIGIVMVAIEGFGMSNSIITEQSMDASLIGSAVKSMSVIALAIAYSFTTAVAEETLTRGAMNSIAENYTDGYAKGICKYMLIPLIFASMHYFMWLSTGLLNTGYMMAIFLIIYHFSFAVVCQISLDVTGSIYTSITIHTVYNACKSLMAWGILVWGGHK